MKKEKNSLRQLFWKGE